MKNPFDKWERYLLLEKVSGLLIMWRKPIFRVLALLAIAIQVYVLMLLFSFNFITAFLVLVAIYSTAIIWGYFKYKDEL